ncbi:MAG: hypothetical protein M1113_00800 [Candidatus Thermoplasmatota archaeon]|nr:hypothetical protein [Candidatus Thermoplasmatota archaeon]
MNLNIKFLAYILVAAMILGSIPFAIQNETSNGSSGILPYSLSVHNVNISITNPGANVSSPFDEMIVVNSTIFSAFENHNLSNVYFTYSNGTVLPSWLESGNSVSDNNTTYWLRINQTIPKGQVLEVHMNFLPLGQIAFNNYSTGEAPRQNFLPYTHITTTVHTSFHFTQISQGPPLTVIYGTLLSQTATILPLITVYALLDLINCPPL